MCSLAQPGSSLVSRTRVKTLASETVSANARFFGGDLSKVPTMALTVGVGTVMDAREVLVLITGACVPLVLCFAHVVAHRHRDINILYNIYDMEIY